MVPMVRTAVVLKVLGSVSLMRAGVLLMLMAVCTAAVCTAAVVRMVLMLVVCWV